MSDQEITNNLGKCKTQAIRELAKNLINSVPINLDRWTTKTNNGDVRVGIKDSDSRATSAFVCFVVKQDDIRVNFCPSYWKKVLNKKSYDKHQIAEFLREEFGTFDFSQQLIQFDKEINFCIDLSKLNNYPDLIFNRLIEKLNGSVHTTEDEEGDGIGANDMENEKNFKSPLNQIIYGPPGTGKTYSTIDAALEILDPEFLETHKDNRKYLKDRFDELVKNQHIRFVTFHQSFSYEDFVEGLSAETENGQIRYEVKPGIFMQLCEAAVSKVVKQEAVNIDVSNRRVWKMSLGNTLGDDAYIFDECIAENKILLGYGRLIDFGGCKNREEVFNKFVAAGRNDVTNDSYDVTSVTTFVTKMQIGDLVVISEGNYKFRAIGEVISDYQFSNRDEQDDHYGQSRSVRWLRVYQPSLPYEQLLNKSFSQMTIYHLKDQVLDREKLAALLGGSTELLDAAPNQAPRVLIIDEINRGNISKIFGELITLIEPSKRDGEKEVLEVILPYSKKPFSVPSNVYIIGTMNTSDRSLSGLDIALRRRFVFKEMPPKPELLDAVTVEGINIGELLRVMNQRIEVLLGRDHCLGHAYFMSLTNESTIGDLADIFQKQIFPLLQEYFFEDWQRIQWVLNDHNKASLKFIERKEEGLINALFGADVPITEAQLPWVINEQAFFSVDAYQGIIKVNV